ncbi:putative Chromo domain protein Chp1p [Aspergillus saccharolyticus JOP 1030-1]|uniref:Chromo domain-containing protein n=1 Tax=Aspergillus saccharolyticus JOP 1030-1 TaxID=1450539 RepID=A0A319AV39_9EURO|nr:hypothetical protein BP01DRAFT_9633 [Aspergillus saccharolyticus JOP 1030-1]PYH49932.1 hypothetical protein BP01DRAFT_9633 [Aspergillus saccharolyticus JOP 1030-1]
MPDLQEVDDDEISITSTAPSEQKSEYEIEEVLAEGRFEDGVKYLVQWAGYPPERNSWEPASAFTNKQTILEWRQKNKDIAAGKCKGFDVDAWLQYMEEFEEKREDRKRRRAAKRRRLEESAGHDTRQAQARTRKVAQKTSSLLSPREPLHRRCSTDQELQTQRRVANDPPPILFSSGKPSHHSQRRNILQSSSGTNAGKLFPNLSSKWWHQKAQQRELEPDVNRLNLRRPSEWPANPPVLPSQNDISNMAPPQECNPDAQPALASESASEPYRRRSPGKLDETPTRAPEPAELRKDRPYEASLARPPRGGKTLMTPAGPRIVGPGELLIRILYGPDRRIIGTARLCGLEGRIRSELFRLKQNHNLDIWFQHVCTLNQYQTIAPNAIGTAFDVGWIEGYEDTLPDIRNMSHELKRENTVAIYNFEKAALAFLAYPSDSLDFRYLSNIRKDLPETYIHIHVRESLDSIGQLYYSAGPQNSFTRNSKNERGERIQRMNTFENMPTSEVYDDTRKEHTRPAQAANSTAETAPRQPKSPKYPAHETIVKTPSLPTPFQEVNTHPLLPEPAASEAMDIDLEESPTTSAQKPLASDGQVDLKAIFKTQFGVNFETLVKVNAGSKTQLAKALYLMFPEDPEYAKEFQLLAEFLKKYNPVVYSSQYEGDWEKFARTVSAGVVFFHESFTSFHTLPFFKALILKSSVGFWSVSLLKPLQFADHPSHFQRIFPHGCVILMTEDFMLREPHATAILLVWMSDWVKRKVPGNWKMMFRPDVLNWVLQQHDSTSSQKVKESWLTMYRLILQLCTPSAFDTPPGRLLSGSTGEYFESNAISPPELPGYGSRTEQEHPDLPAGATRELLDADHMIEFFAGWGLVNCHLYRRFVVVTCQRLPKWAEWNHIEVKSCAKDFMDAFKIPYKFYWETLRRKPKLEGRERVQATPYTPYTPRTPRTPGGGGHRPQPLGAALDEHNARKDFQDSQYNYPEPYH